MQIRHILLTTDLSTESLRPCLAVAELAQGAKARITLLHVVYEFQLAPHGAPLAPPITPLDSAREVREAEKTLAEQKKLLGEGASVTTAVVTGDRVHEAIAKYAKSHGVDLIALSTHGRTGFRHFALGSVAEALLRESDVPVLVFPRHE
jgi:nucleotide-binding universal stress UspA family protein